VKALKISIDKFRIIAAILIIAIHIFPFASINETVDFVFTHVICRIGVPFFFMITGYFVLPKAMEDKNKLIKYTLKIIKIYVICILIYLPINLYAGQLNNITIIEAIKNICINGTFYHLWYFPAVILGIWVTYFFIKHLNKTLSIISIVILYVIGIFGDSYFGISKQSIIISKIYDAIFMIADYTRNGLFFAPIFISLGYSFNNMKNKISQNKSAIFTIIFTFFMIFEGIILKHFNLQKHDSMYFMLVPTMFFIFNILVQINNENNKKLDEAMENNDWILYAKTIQEIQNKERYKKEFNLRIDNKVEYKFDYLNQAIKNYSDGLSLKDQVSKKQAKEEKEKYLVSQYIVENKQNIMKTDTIEMKLQEFYNYNDIIIIFAVMLISAGVALNKEQNNASCIINILKILAYTIGVIALGIIIQIISAMIVYKIGFAGLPGWIIFNEKMIVANPLIITGIRMLLRLPIYLVISVFMYSIIKKRKS